MGLFSLSGEVLFAHSNYVFWISLLWAHNTEILYSLKMDLSEAAV